MPKRTIPRPEELNELSPHEAAYNVITYIGAPQQDGRWSIREFEVSPEQANIDYLRSHGDGGGRWCPPGKYLQLFWTDEPDGVGETMMSNTPDEINDHDAVFDYNPGGRILVNGLGLSCIVSGLLTQDHIEHIDVLELDESIIKMVGPAFDNEPRVTIHHGDALTYEWPSDARWDFVWHDIWAKISDLNLDDDKAENGVSYRKLFQRYADRAGMQAAWAFDLALAMRRCGELADDEAERWSQRWREADYEGRIEIQLDFMSQLNGIDIHMTKGDAKELLAVREQKRAAWQRLMDHDPKMKERVEAAAHEDEQKFWVDDKPFLPQARLELPQLIEEELAEYGLGTSAFGFATQPIGATR